MGRVDIRLRREHRLVVVIVSARKVVRRIVLTVERDFPVTTRSHFLVPDVEVHGSRSLYAGVASGFFIS